MTRAALYTSLAALVVIVWIATLPLRPLFNPDEGRYAEIPREMLSGGDWIIPHLDGLAYVEKPPLQYWATALCMRILGQNELGARFYTALCAIGTLLVVWLLARRLFGVPAAWSAAAMLSSMLLFIALGQLLTLDMSLTFFLTLALAGFLAAQAAPEGRHARGFMLMAWVAAALGVLTKGLVAALIPGAVLVLYSLHCRDLAPWRRLDAALGVPLFLALTVPWYGLAAHRLPDFLEFFFVHEHLARYLTPSADREQPWWFFGAVFLLGSVPWTLPALRVLFGGWRREAPGGAFQARPFLWIWVVFVCAFFSFSDSKLIPYILPAMPALALLMAALPAEVLRRDVLATATLTLVAAIGLAALCALAPQHIGDSVRARYFLQLARPLEEIAVLLAASGLYVLSQRHRDMIRRAVFLAVGWSLSGLLLVRASALVAPLYSGEGLARALPGGPRDDAVYSVGTYDQTLPFYWRHTVELAAYRGELDYGLRHDPGAALPDVAAFVVRWNAQSSAYAVMEQTMFEDLTKRGVPMREVARNPRRILVARQ